MIVLHNYDEPGKIGGVGGILGKHGINVKFMTVAALESVVGDGEGDGGEGRNEKGESEALMILGVKGVVGKEVERELQNEEGILDVSVVRL